MAVRVQVRTDARRVVWCGDSMSNYAPDGDGIAVSGYVMAGRGIPWNNEAVDGTTADQARTRRSLVLRWAPFAAEPYVVIVTGHNSYASFSQTGAQVYEDISDLAEACKADGFTRAYATTSVPSSSITGGEDTERLAGNALLLSDADGFLDGVIDWAAEPSLQVPAYDGIHFNQTQRIHAASVCADVIFP